jgi:5,10-methylenetetrahydromethanopterin reductase
MDISCAFATGLQTPDHIALAERLGYRRAWCYDSPALYADVWMALALAAERTRTIGLGPAVLVPSLRHVVTNAAAIGTLAALAPGRVSVAVGAGFTGRLALGQRPLPWRRVRDYVVALRALLRGDAVEWQDTTLKLLQLPGFAAARPLDVPLLLGVNGPRGLAVAREVADGLIGSSVGATEQGGRFTWAARMTNGTVLDPGEAPDSARAFAAAAHGAALAFHAAYERGRAGELPGGDVLARYMDSLPPQTRHLVLHEGHLVAANSVDAHYLTPELVARFGRVLSRDEWRSRLAGAASEGVTELIYQPAGPDIPRELGAFAEMAELGPPA